MKTAKPPKEKRRHGLGVNKHQKPRKDQVKPKEQKGKRRDRKPGKQKIKRNVSAESETQNSSVPVDKTEVQFKPIKEQAAWFSAAFCSIHGGILSQFELSSVPDDAMVQLSEEDEHSLDKLVPHMKAVFGPSWEDDLSGAATASKDGSNVDVGSPSLLILSSSAVRCVEVLKSLRDLTKSCKPAKLFAKHLKVEEQVEALRKRVNIAAGTPSRVKKLIDIGALGINRLQVLVLDIHKDVKGLNLLMVPEVRKEFWELYRLHFHRPVVEHKLRICLY